MAANNQLPPIPNNPITDVFVWRDWFYQVSQVLTQQASIAWTSINFTGSNLRDIVTRQHNALQDIQGGIANQYYHLTATEYSNVQALPTLGTMATQNSNSVTITGGTITATITATGGATGTFLSADTIPKTITVTNGIITSIV